MAEAKGCGTCGGRGSITAHDDKAYKRGEPEYYETPCDDCLKGLILAAIECGDDGDYPGACKLLREVAERVERAEAALRGIAAGSPPDDWAPRDRFGDYAGHGTRGAPDFVDEVDSSNSGDVHSHGYAVGRWEAAKAARAGLRGEGR